MLAAIASALAVAAVGTTTASAGLNPGRLTVFDETVDVNVVFVGTFGGTDPDWNAVKAGLRRARRRRRATSSSTGSTTRRPDLFLANVKELPSGFESRLTADYQDIAARNHTSFLDGMPAYEAGLVNWSIGQ